MRFLCWLGLHDYKLWYQHAVTEREYKVCRRCHKRRWIVKGG